MIGRREVVGAALAAGALSFAGAGRAAAQATARVVTNGFDIDDVRVLFTARIGEKGPYQFVLDTGGQYSIIDDALARQLGLKPFKVQTGAGVGGAHDGAGYLIEDFRLAAGRLPPMPFIGMARGLGRGRGTVGSIGAGLFTSSDTDIDFAKKELRIYPDGRPDRDGWTKSKSRFILGGKFPPLVAVEVEIDGYKVELVADTGAPSVVTLDGPATKASGLWDDGKPYAPTGSRGIGTALAKRRIVRAGKVRVGPLELDRPLVTITPPDKGESYVFKGMLGLQALRRVNLSSDVRGQALWMQTNGLPAQGRTDYSLSGLWLTEQGGRTMVEDVGTGSPAAAAGVAKGDVVVGMPLSAAIAAITGRQGQEIALKLERGGAAREVTFALAEYL